MRPPPSFVPRLATMALLLFQGQGMAQTTTCKTFRDADSPLALAIASELDVSSEDMESWGLSDIFQELDETLPWLSSCAASLDPIALIETVSSYFDGESSTGSSSALQDCVATISDADVNLEDLNLGFRTQLCPLIKDTIMPCIQTALEEVVMAALEDTGGCCDAFQAEIESQFSDALPLMVEKLTKLGVNAFCGERTFTNLAGDKTTEACGFSIFTSFENFDGNVPFWDFGQLPNDQMCNAFEGKPFTNTKGGESQFPFGVDGVDTMGICLQPVDAMLQHLRSWPIFKQALDVVTPAGSGSLSLADLFTSGTSIRASMLLWWARTTTSLPMVIVRTIDLLISSLQDWGADVEGMWGAHDSLASFIQNSNEFAYVMSIARVFLGHIPNSGGCTYAGQEISLPYQVSSTSSSQTPATSEWTVSCKTLKDSDSFLGEALAPLLDISTSRLDSFGLDAVFSELDAALPAVSKCVASMNPMSVMYSGALSSTVKTCIAKVSDVNLDYGSINDILRKGVCPFFKQEGVDCVKMAVQEIAMDVMNSAMGCCDDLLQEVNDQFNNALPEMVEQLMYLVGNIVCSDRTFENLAGATTTEACGFSIINSFGALSNMSEESLTSFLQIPNEAMCAAFEGEAFTNTKGGTTQFSFGTEGVDTMGICLTTLDAVMLHLKSWPFFQQTLDAAGTSLSLTDWFTTGKTIRPNVLLDWATTSTNLPMIVVRTVDKLVANLVAEDVSAYDAVPWDADTTLEEVATDAAASVSSSLKAFNTHMPNGANCVYTGQKISLAFEVGATTETPAATTSAPVTVSTEVSEAVSGPSGHWVVASVAIGAAFFGLVGLF